MMQITNDSNLVDKVDEHRTKLILILGQIYSDPRLSRALGFKGGTAAYFFYDLPRMSVDLDFNLLYPEEEEYVHKTIAEMLPRYGEVADATIKHYTIFFLLKYKVGSWKIKIEISRRPSLAKYQPLSVLGVSALVMKREDMVACKLAALLTRKKMVMRDVFDMWYFLSQEWEIEKKVFESQTEWSLKEGLERALVVVEGLQKNEMLQGVAELLTEKQRMWVKGQMKRELLLLLRLRLERVS